MAPFGTAPGAGSAATPEYAVRLPPANGRIIDGNDEILAKNRKAVNAVNVVKAAKAVNIVNVVNVVKAAKAVNIVNVVNVDLKL